MHNSYCRTETRKPPPTARTKAHQISQYSMDQDQSVAILDIDTICWMPHSFSDTLSWRYFWWYFKLVSRWHLRLFGMCKVDPTALRATETLGIGQWASGYDTVWHIMDWKLFAKLDIDTMDRTISGDPERSFYHPVRRESSEMSMKSSQNGSNVAMQSVDGTSAKQKEGLTILSGHCGQ